MPCLRGRDRERSNADVWALSILIEQRCSPSLLGKVGGVLQEVALR